MAGPIWELGLDPGVRFGPRDERFSSWLGLPVGHMKLGGFVTVLGAVVLVPGG